ncbi:hemagglutinin [Burkholderia cenocepacia]|jgi:autotransporter adhesin|uniref:hemagglutinin n=1 Tax=Burkholderia cenocepacia TaxID=95486 RepID=UPI0005C2AB6E|nr:hemagglutinin [Burkholderia cenocepacia]KIS52306.1 coiled stalk of trimeric autotransporter adhesin family protein [Burkholderia cepacia]QNN06015.1 hypothetical protein K562_20234 [Burkholderia cenocepacia]SPU81911.1 YadA domain-containing protein [Burkholderia cenocepacia]SPV03463.1 YadA domain-containing protein [Burkholderia cenocepacia]
MHTRKSAAIGPTSSATASNAVALGYGASPDRENTVSVGSDTRQRQIVNVADGTTGTDAVNLRQLNAIDDRVTTLDAKVDGISAQAENHTQGITAIRADLNSGTIGLVQQSSPGADLTVGKAKNGAAVNFTSTDGDRKLTRLGEGEVSSASNDAVNGKQLNANNVSVKNLSSRVDGVDGTLTQRHELAARRIHDDSRACGDRRDR